MKRQMVKMSLALAALTVAALMPLLGQAQGSENHAGLVVRYSDGRVDKLCVAFTEEKITGFDLLSRSGLPLIAESSGIGAAVCKIRDEGCNYPAQDCFCQRNGATSIYWAFHMLDNNAWRFSPLGASSVSVRNGDVQGWAWGTGSASQGAQPPLTTFAEVCGSVAVPPTSASATAVAPSSTPVATVQPSATATSAPTSAAPTSAAPTQPASAPASDPAGQPVVGAVASPTARVVVPATDVPTQPPPTSAPATATQAPPATLAPSPSVAVTEGATATILPATATLASIPTLEPPPTVVPPTAAPPTAAPPVLAAQMRELPASPEPTATMPAAPPTLGPAGGAPVTLGQGGGAAEARSADYLTFLVLAAALAAGIGYKLWRRRSAASG